MQLLPLLALLLSATPQAEELPFELPEWKVGARVFELEEHLGRPSLRLQGGTAWLEGLEFDDGEIQVDVAVSPERSFVGVQWHERDGSYEYFYVRPHQSGNPDACQYTPVHNGSSAWQLFHGPGYGAPLELKHDEWMTLRIVVSGTRAEVYVGSDEEPGLVIRELMRGGEPGLIGLAAADFAPAHFSRLRVTPGDGPPLRGTPPPAPELPAGLIESYEVSGAFEEGRLAGVHDLADLGLAATGWTRLPVEENGVANLARVQGPGPSANTVLARVRLRSDRARFTPLTFGFSDRVHVFLNGRLLYSGANDYLSRDYRYLGTIGLFDSLPLALVPGENELVLAVSESFGGWGVIATLGEEEGLTVLD